MTFMEVVRELEVAPETIAITLCVVLASILLTQYTRIGGLTGFVMNALMLFAGAFGALYLTHGMDLRIGYFLERTLLVSFGGILVGSLLVLLLFSRSRQG